MSHLVSIQTKVKDFAAVGAACRRLKLPPLRHGTTQLYAAEVEGILVNLPEWRFPIVIDLASGAVRFDNYNGAWGHSRELNRFLQAYAVEKATLEARRQGYQVTEEAQANGSIKLHIAVT